MLLLVNRVIRDGSFTVGDLALFISYMPRTTEVTVRNGETVRGGQTVIGVLK